MTEQNYDDVVDGRKGPWMQTSMGGRFFPQDPRSEDFCISDLANGMALDCRYGGQGRVDRFYSVAEHSWHMAYHALNEDKVHPRVAFAVLMHDAAEGFLNDLTRAVKKSVGDGYERLEQDVQDVIHDKYDLVETSIQNCVYIKDLDRRIVPLEKAAIMRYPQAWAFDQFEALPNTHIQCWAPLQAKANWLNLYDELCKRIGIEPEAWEL